MNFNLKRPDAFRNEPGADERKRGVALLLVTMLGNNAALSTRQGTGRRSCTGSSTSHLSRCRVNSKQKTIFICASMAVANFIEQILDMVFGYLQSAPGDAQLDPV